MYLHKKGKVAKYQAAGDGYFDLVGRPDGYIWFDNQIYHPVSMPPNSYASKEEAYAAAMDYHETEGCKLYLELYPAPEKGEWDWIAQEIDGDWYGFSDKPTPSIRDWMIEWGEAEYICSSPPNPFWRKTLQ